MKLSTRMTSFTPGQNLAFLIIHVNNKVPLVFWFGFHIAKFLRKNSGQICAKIIPTLCPLSNEFVIRIHLQNQSTVVLVLTV